MYFIFCSLSFSPLSESLALAVLPHPSVALVDAAAAVRIGAGVDEQGALSCSVDPLSARVAAGAANR